MEDLSLYRSSDLLYTQEKLSRYAPGGYHPVTLGDEFHDGRYVILHKLGWGGFSTVWLARDKKCSRWVSVKIKTADSTKQSQELSCLRALASHSGGSVSSSYVVELLDEFVHHGPNGRHQCLVFELLGPSVDLIVANIHDCKDSLQPKDILRLSAQLLQANAFIHGAGFAHGDISSRNIAFTCSGLSESTEEDMLKFVGSPKIEELVRLDGEPLEEGLPSQLVEAAGWKEWVDEDEEDLRIIDFGEAFVQGAEPEKIAQPAELQAPETIFTDGFDYRLDLWRAGTAIYTFVFGTLPFSYWGGSDGLAEQMIGFVEELPAEWEKKSEDIQDRRAKAGGKPLERDSPTLKPRLEQKFEQRVHKPSLKPLLPVIQGLMRLRPGDRIPASEALELVRSAIEEADFLEEYTDSDDDNDGDAT